MSDIHEKKPTSPPPVQTPVSQPPTAPPVGVVQAVISNFILPNTVDINTSYFKIQTPFSNSTAPFIFSSSNINIINIINNTAIVTGIGSVIITVTQNAINGYTSASTSSTINVISYTNNNNNTNNIFFKLSGLEISNYNPFTNILNTNENWNYFKYSNNNNHKISSQINLTTTNDVFNYSKLSNSDVYILYCGPGGNYASKPLTTTTNTESKNPTTKNSLIYCGGGSGELALTKINSSDINDNTIISINFTTNNKTTISYTTNSNITKIYSVNSGLNGSFSGTNPNFIGIGGSGGAKLRTGTYQNNYNGALGYNNDTICLGSGSGYGYGTGNSGIYTTNNNGILTNITPINNNNYGVLIDFNNVNIPSDNTGSVISQYGGTKNFLDGPDPFVLIFYKVNNNYKNITINSNSLYNKLTNVPQIFNMYNYNPFNKLKKLNSNWVYNLITNSDNISYIFNLINNNLLFEQSNLNLLFNTTSKIYKINGNINILYIGGGGIGGLSGAKNYYSGGGGGGGGMIKLISQQLNSLNSFHNFEIKIGTSGNYTSCIYNTINSSINYGNATQGNNGLNASYNSVTTTNGGGKGSYTSTVYVGGGGNGGNGINIDINSNILGATPGGGGTGNTNGLIGTVNSNLLYYSSENSSKTNSAVVVSLNNNLGSILTGWSGFGGTNGQNGQNGNSGYCLIYFEVTTTN